MKTYTSECLYSAIGEKLTTGNFSALNGYLLHIIQNLPEHGNQYSYKADDGPVFRGMVPLGYYKKEDYNVNSIGMYTTF